MRKLFRILQLVGLLTINATTVLATDMNLVFWLNTRSMDQAVCMDRADNAVKSAGLALINKTDWYVFAARDQATAFITCQYADRSGSLLNITVSRMPTGPDNLAFAQKLVAFMDNPNSPREPAISSYSNAPNLTWWVDVKPITVNQCVKQGQAMLEAEGIGKFQKDSWWIAGEATDGRDMRGYITCVAYNANTMVHMVLTSTPNLDVAGPMGRLGAFLNDPTTIPKPGDLKRDDKNKIDQKIVTLGGKSDAKKPSGKSDLSLLTQRRSATTNCADPSGSTTSDVRFTLAAATTVQVIANNPPGKPTWWVAEQDYDGPVIANVFDGVAQVTPAGSDFSKGLVALPAGTFVFHVDCGSSGLGRVSAELRLPAMPKPAGPRYLVSAKDQNDRIIWLTEAQTLTFVDIPPTGYITDFNQSLLWSSDAKKVEAWSTRDLMPGGYCLHGEWPDGPNRTFAAEFIGPAQPSGKPTKLTATAKMGPDGVEQSKGVQFRLDQAQIIQVRAETGWIMDEHGYIWFNIVSKEIQSGSAWIQSIGRIDPVVKASKVKLPVSGGRGPLIFQLRLVDRVKLRSVGSSSGTTRRGP